MQPDLTIVIMAYNEEENLPVQLERTVSFLEGLGDGWQVVVVNDGSSDGTGAVADEWAARYPGRLEVVHHPENRGMGAAIRNGYAAARMGWVTQLPADCQVDPQVFHRFLAERDAHDLVLSVYSKRGDGWMRGLLSWGFQTFIRLALGERGDFTGTMMFRRELLDRVGTLHGESFFVNLEFPILALRLGTSHTVLEITPQPRLHGSSKVANLARIRFVVRETLAMRTRDRAT
jgi:glycosyltransferase involved in cell wall biosynthesis